MPPNNNGHKPQTNPTEMLNLERSEVKCQRCHKPFKYFVIETIDDMVQLRCCDVLITSAEITCLRCGWVFHWEMRERDLEKMTLAYGQVLVKIGVYVPE